MVTIYIVNFFLKINILYFEKMFHSCRGKMYMQMFLKSYKKILLKTLICWPKNVFEMFLRHLTS